MIDEPAPDPPYSRFIENGEGPLIVDPTNATGPKWDIVGWLKARKKPDAGEHGA